MLRADDPAVADSLRHFHPHPAPITCVPSPVCVRAFVFCCSGADPERADHQPGGGRRGGGLQVGGRTGGLGGRVHKGLSWDGVGMRRDDETELGMQALQQIASHVS